MLNGKKRVFCLLSAFLLLAGGYRLGGEGQGRPYQVSVTRADQPAAEDPLPTADSSRPDSLLEGERINVNTAGYYDLMRLPGIGEIPFRIRTLSLENRLSPSGGTLALVYHQTFGGARRQVEMTLTLSREEENHADP